MRLEIANRHGLQHRLQPLKPYDARSSRCGRVSRRSPSIAKASAASEGKLVLNLQLNLQQCAFKFAFFYIAGIEYLIFIVMQMMC